LAVATSAGRRNIDLVLGGLGLNYLFDVIVSGDEVPQGKSGPEIYLETARRLGICPGLCLVFEDSPPGIEAAHLAGMRVIVVGTNPRADEFRSLPPVIKVVDDFVLLEPGDLMYPDGTDAQRKPMS
jgi:beta-phosphoglucomutase-like phosphatase (HAD superfamily)